MILKTVCCYACIAGFVTVASSTSCQLPLRPSQLKSPVPECVLRGMDHGSLLPQTPRELCCCERHTDEQSAMIITGDYK